ncbi:MAG TPA: hypothetical protein VMX55_08200 [candidate division Zixibacteria bacterium]|nr:hypothetical protein [candidate division Zixibacteria bacterium]
MEINISYYYWHEVMGPMVYFSNGKFQINEENLLLLLSSVEPYTTSNESTISGPYYVENQVIMAYNRSLNYPDAHDERLRLMGTDSWVIISCKQDNELVLLSMCEIIKMILDVEFGIIDEVSQLETIMAERSANAIKNLFN